jgi:hypothetical protein
MPDPAVQVDGDAVRRFSVTDKVKQARALIERVVEELEAERQELTSALAALGRDGFSRDGRQRAAARPRPKRQRARRGQRQEQFLKAVARHAGEPVSVLAREIGIPPQQLYPIAKKLIDDDRIVKSGRGYELTSNGRRGPATRANTKQST